MVELEDVVAAADALLALAGRSDDDQRWQAAAVPTSWTAVRTLEHVADALVFYAGQVARRADQRLPVLRDGRPAPPSEQLDNVLTAAHLLTGQLRDLGSGRAWHPSGSADAAGWAGMAITELLVHGTDAAHAVGVELARPPEVCARTLARVFPWIDPALAPPAELLLAVTGRSRTAGVPQDPDWWWQSAPARGVGRVPAAPQRSAGVGLRKGSRPLPSSPPTPCSRPGPARTCHRQPALPGPAQDGRRARRALHQRLAAAYCTSAGCPASSATGVQCTNVACMHALCSCTNVARTVHAAVGCVRAKSCARRRHFTTTAQVGCQERRGSEPSAGARTVSGVSVSRECAAESHRCK